MKTIAVIFGGRSAEHDVSIVTAISSVIKPLELLGGYNVVPIYIAKDGAWYSDRHFKNIDIFSKGMIDKMMSQRTPVALEFNGGLKLVKQDGRFGKSNAVPIDIVFPAMHGTYGEDGALMGLLELAGIPYVGCGTAAAAIAMDKVLAKQVAQAEGINVTKFLAFTKSEIAEDTDAIIAAAKSLTYPLFVKPAHLGSSIGISRVKDADELRNALEVAAHYDNKVIVEEAVNNLIEVTLPIIGNEQPRPALLEKPLTAPEDFFDFETKYMQGGKKGKGSKGGAQGYSQIPADLPKELYDRAEQTGLAVYKAIGCEGIARVDMLIDSKTNEIYFNELNPLPGGLYAHNWAKAGLSSVELVRALVDYAQQRHDAKADVATAFSTNYLKQF